jgi:hypothetical protein
MLLHVEETVAYVLSGIHSAAHAGPGPRTQRDNNKRRAGHNRLSHTKSIQIANMADSEYAGVDEYICSTIIKHRQVRDEAQVLVR